MSPLTLTAGTRLGSYEILSALGAGGMGEVYRAMDSNLGRQVAIKVLPDAVAQDPERVARFEREAKTLAALNHPHIAAIYGLERSSGMTALVMELVEGPTLADRIAQGSIPLDEALPIARQIAEALEAAHEQGIIHRDLKPANVKVRPDGTVKVLDFGLAKATDPAGSRPDVSQSPTITTPAMTQAGMILGTAAYMSPEQAKGRAADRRSDIWAFGVVVYEILTGQRAFNGEDVSDTLAAVLRGEPDWTALPANTPEPIRRLLRRCLEKDHKRRLDSAAAARVEIEDAIAGPTAVTPPTARPMLWIAAAAAVATVAALALSAVHFREASPLAVERMRFEFPFPEHMRPSPRSVPALSPDGREVAFVATGPDGQNRLWTRPLDALEAKPLAGTEGAYGSPFWSPDSRVVVYLDRKLESARKLRKIDASGGPSQVICDFPLPTLRGGFWDRHGRVVFGTGGGTGGLYQVAAAGGVAAPLTTLLEGEVAHGYPVLLPDGKHFLYERHGYEGGLGGVFVGLLGAAPAEQASRKLLSDLENVAYVPSTTPGRGFLLFVREGTLFAQSFDGERFALAGELQPVAVGVSVAAPDPFALFSAAANGVLIYQREGFAQNRQHIWIDRHGQVLGRVGEPAFYGGVSLSADGSQAAYGRVEGQRSDLWLFDFTRGFSRRFTTNPARNWNATWSPDASRIIYASTEGGPAGLWQKAVGGTGSEELILRPGVPLDWSSDGKFVLFTRDGDLWVLPDPRVASDHMPMPLTRTTFAETVGKFSPNVHWLAVQSDESGQNEIYVHSFDVSSTTVSLGGNKTEVSTKGGTDPRWRADGKELFYVAADQRMMSVAVTTTGGFQAGVPQPLFAVPESASWDVAPDGQRFLFTVPDGKSTPPPFTVVLNWQAGLKK